MVYGISMAGEQRAMAEEILRRQMEWDDLRNEGRTVFQAAMESERRLVMRHSRKLGTRDSGVKYEWLLANGAIE